MKKVIMTLMAVVMFLGINITADAQTIFPDCMRETDDGRIEVNLNMFNTSIVTNGEDGWKDAYYGYPYHYITEEFTEEAFGQVFTYHKYYFDYYLSDVVNTPNEPDFVMECNGVKFYFATQNPSWTNYDVFNQHAYSYYVRYCYDEELGWWLYDKSYKGSYFDGEYEWNADGVPVVPKGKFIAKIKDQIERGEYDISVDTIDLDYATAETGMKFMLDTEDIKGKEPADPYADINTLGATVKLSTDCFYVKQKNTKTYVAQKPVPSSVKVGKTALKKNKTYTISYEKYNNGYYEIDSLMGTDNGWYEVDAITDEGVYRLVITGQNGYEGVYKKRLYVTDDKSIKKMSSAAVKVNNMSYTGEPITSGVIKSVKVGKRVLTEGVDYTVSYANNTDIGNKTAQVTLTATEESGLLGTKTVNFTITANKIQKAKVTGLKSITYNPNQAMEQNMSDVRLVFGATKTQAGTELKEGIDYTVSYTNNTKAGTARITFTGTGIYTGTLTRTFKITKAPLNADMLDDASKKIEVTYTGTAVKPEVTLKNGNTTLVKGTDYTLAYSNNIKESTADKPAQITVTGKGNYSGSFKVGFKVVSNSSNTTGKTNTENIESDTDEPVIDEEPATEEETVTEEEPSTEDEAVTEEEPATEDETVIDEESETDDNGTDNEFIEDSESDSETEAEDTIEDTVTDGNGTDNEVIEDSEITEEIVDDVEEIQSIEDAVSDVNAA